MVSIMSADAQPNNLSRSESLEHRRGAALMRPRAISGVPGLDPKASAFERFEKFVRMIISVPKAEADTEMEKSGLRKKSRKPRASNR
jgi:hypothetical protein